MLNIRISHCSDGVEKVIEISDKDVSAALSAEMSNAPQAVAGASGRFVDNGDGTVTDRTTGLMWTKDNVGTDRMNHAAAESACNALTIGDHKDWRLPTRAELLTLVDDTRHDPAIDKSTFPTCKSNYYWSSTPTAWNSAGAWFVGFDYGYASDGYRASTAFVRAVRVAPAGQ